MSEPIQPQHPFIEPGNAEGTYLAINGVLTLLRERRLQEGVRDE